MEEAIPTWGLDTMFLMVENRKFYKPINDVGLR